MWKTRKIRKTEFCLNCDQKLSEEINFCPNCGQRNQDNYVSISQLLNDFFSNYFSFDSRFAHSILPFFFKPGFLTQKFVEGKRVHYANPIRLYLVISLIHFFILSFVPDVEDSSNSPIKIGSNDSSYNIKDDSLQISLARKEADLDSAFSIPYKSINRLKQATELSNKEIYDTLEIERGELLDRITAQQVIKIAGEKGSSINRYLLSNLPVIVFLLLPVFALLLKLFWFRKGLYIKHLVHSLHLHTFGLMILALFWILVLLGVSSDQIIWGIFIIFIYILISSYRLYHQSIFKTMIKLFFLSIFYFISVAFIMLFGTIVSILFY